MGRPPTYKAFLPKPATIDHVGGGSDFVLPNHSGITSHPEFKKAVSGATGTFTAASGETVTVVNGLVTFITAANFLILLETGDKILMENGDNIQNG